MYKRVKGWYSIYIYIYIRYKVPGLFSYWSFESNGCEIFSSFLLDIHMRRRRRLIPARHQYNIPPAVQKNVSFLSIFGLLKFRSAAAGNIPTFFHVSFFILLIILSLCSLSYFFFFFFSFVIYSLFTAVDNPELCRVIPSIIPPTSSSLSPLKKLPYSLLLSSI